MYCSLELADETAVEVCKKCGHSVWGETMFTAIKGNMQEAREKGDI